MYTQCRGCGEIFTLLVDDVIHSHGKVRCNMCGTVFDALETLSSERPHEDEDLILHDFSNPPPLLTRSYEYLPDHDNDSSVREVDTANVELFVEEVVPETDNPDDPFDREFRAPDFIDDSEYSEYPAIDEDIPFVTVKKNKRVSKHVLVWLLLSLAMLAMLIWQTVKALQVGAIKLPEHDLSTKICDSVQCGQAKKKINFDAISLVSRNIRPHPGRDQALIISASMINSNKLMLDFPTVEVKLSDLDGKPMAMRRFLPKEYLQAEILEAGFLSDTLIPFTLEVQSPGEQAVAFEIDFVQ